MPRHGAFKSDGFGDDIARDADDLARDDFEQPQEFVRRAPTLIPNPADWRPFRNTGKLLFRTAEGEITWCRAEFVGSERVLMTAAHCVYDFERRSLSTNFTFLQAYRDGSDSDRFGIECLAMSFMPRKDRTTRQERRFGSA